MTCLRQDRLRVTDNDNSADSWWTANDLWRTERKLGEFHKSGFGFYFLVLANLDDDNVFSDCFYLTVLPKRPVRRALFWLAWLEWRVRTGSKEGAPIQSH